MLEVVHLAQRAAVSDAKVLLTGESGVGKDVIAHAIHDDSSRVQGPFVAVNCAGLTETLLESELFGHERGSFTGAYRDKPGKLQLAHHGTLFLDEVGEMSLRMQALLLRFLETGELQRVGSSERVKRVDVRVVAATNRNLPERVAAGEFREDLLYRLRVIHIHVPPLRERRYDIPLLVAHFAGNRKPPVQFTPAALDKSRTLPLARQRPRAAERRRAGGVAVADADDRRRAPAGVRARDRRARAAESAGARSPTISTMRS